MARVSVDEFSVLIQSDVIDEIETIVTDIFNGVVSRTPVWTGRARASWNVGIGKPDRTLAPIGGSKENPQPPPEMPRLRLKEPVPVYIDNAIPYIQYLEYGSPTTAATGMVKASLSSYI